MVSAGGALTAAEFVGGEWHMSRELAAARAVSTSFTSRRVGVGVAVGLALGACLESNAPMWGSVEGQLELGIDLDPVEVMFLSEEQLAPFLQSRLPQVRSEAEKAALNREALRTRMKLWLEESQRAQEEVARSGADILQRRLEVIRRAVSVNEMAVQRRLLTAASAGARKHAFELQQQAEVARRDSLRADEAALRLADGSYFLAELPQPSFSTQTRFDGSFQAKLAPGRYGVAATAIGADGRRRVWLVWVRIEAGEPTAVLLSENNLALSKCESCVLSPEPIVKR